MARIRTIKPELFRHHELYELEIETGLPIRISWAGLFTVADREGRFKWRQKELKLDILPYDNIDFERVLNALATRGFIVKYAWNSREFGYIPSFKQHQVINNKEKDSVLPDPKNNECEIIDLSTREARVDHAMTESLFLDQGERKGKEGKGKGKGKEGEREGNGFPRELTREIWESYRAAYFGRYKVEPARNVKVNSAISQLAARLGPDAIEVVSFFVSHNEGFYLKKMHSIGLCLQDAESLLTQLKRGRSVTSMDVREFEKTNHFISQVERIQSGEL